MAVELTRRWFVFGSAAAVAAAATLVSEPTNLIKPPIFTPAVAGHHFLRRQVWEIFAGCTEGPGDWSIVELFVGDRCLFHQAIPLATFQWVAFPGSEIICTPSRTFRLAVQSERGIGMVALGCKDWVDDDDPIQCIETHTFPSLGPASVVALELADAERLAHARARS